MPITLTHSPQSSPCRRYGSAALALALSGSLLFTACSRQADDAARTPSSEPVTIDVEVLDLQYRPWQQRISAYGRIVSAEKVVIGVEVAGTVASVHFQEGQTISAGQTLLRLDARKLTLHLERAKANVATAEAELARARGTYQRLQTLIGRQVIAEETYKLSEAAYHAAEARLQQAMAAQKLARQELQDLTLISPVDGVVESESVEPGQRVQPGQTLALIQTTDTLQVITYVTEQEVNLLRQGDTAPVRSPGAPQRIYEARIEAIGNTADRRTGNFPIKLRVDNRDGLLREGMSAQVDLLSREAEKVLAIPHSAITDRARKRVVFLAIDGQAVRIDPVFGMELDGWVPVLSGLAAGDQLIVNRLPLLANRNPVSVTSIIGPANEPPGEGTGEENAPEDHASPTPTP